MAADNAKSSSADTTRELVITRLLDAPPDLVWRVCTQREHHAVWGPKDITISGLEDITHSFSA